MDHPESDWSCPYALDSEKSIQERDITYKGHLALVDRLKEPLGEAFNLNQTQIDKMTFYDLIRYSDTIHARHF